MLLWSYFHLLLYWNLKLVLSICNLFSTEQVWCQEWIPFSAYPGHLFYGPFCTVWVKCSYVEPTVLCLTQVLTEMEMSYWSRCVKTGFKSKDSLQAKRHCFFSLWLWAGNIFEMLIDCCTCFVSVRTVSYGLSFLRPEFWAKLLLTVQTEKTRLVRYIVYLKVQIEGEISMQL